MVEDVRLALKDQNQTILGKNVQLEREVAQLQIHKTFMGSRLNEHSKGTKTYLGSGSILQNNV